MEKSTKPSFSYYSNLLNKPFDTLKELQEAESKLIAEQTEKEKKVEEKRADAKKVEDAFRHYTNVRAEAFKAIKAAEEIYNKERDAFVEKYGSYHFTYSNKDGDVTLGVSDIVENILGGLFDILK